MGKADDPSRAQTVRNYHHMLERASGTYLSDGQCQIMATRLNEFSLPTHNGDGLRCYMLIHFLEAVT
jgi:hypothetical protein